MFITYSGKCILVKQVIWIVLSMCVFVGATLSLFFLGTHFNVFLLSRNWWKHQIMGMNFLLAQKFWLSGVKMESGMKENKNILILTICFFSLPISSTFFSFQHLISWIFRYDATIEAITPNGYYVCFNGWGNKEEVPF